MTLRSPDDIYRSACRSALCYAVTGSREWAFGSLRVAASKLEDGARHHHIYGLIHGSSGANGAAWFELEKARSAEPHTAVRTRIEEALTLCEAPPSARPEWDDFGDSLGHSQAVLNEAVRTLLELLTSWQRTTRG